MSNPINYEELQAVLDILHDSGVEEFEGYGFHVRFSERTEPGKPEEILTERQERTPASSIWEVPELWPGGTPPTFPKRPK